MAKDQTVVEDSNGNVTVNKRNNISVDKTDVVLEDLCCPCGCCCNMSALYLNPSGCFGCMCKNELLGCRTSGKACKCMSPGRNDQKMCCLFSRSECSCHLPTMVSFFIFLCCYLVLLTFFSFPFSLPQF